MWYVYVLRSKKHRKYVYIGSTSNWKRRLKEHNFEDSALCTAPYRPLEIEGYICIKDEKIARTLEKYLKSGSGRAFLNKRILTAEVC